MGFPDINYLKKERIKRKEVYEKYLTHYPEYMGENEPPNLKNVECCGTCQFDLPQSDRTGRMQGYCYKYEWLVQYSDICDSYQLYNWRWA